ncbi:hypothetical protein FOC1_g10010388 [Fusarium oxysporum f. sp. cubense race 1]|uniref:Uncharacterized protein n=1 Tax=Fusarium oxysporum f. sp. cubense (strain race 1) TaxID=1229664 RepID=N4UXW9_FUSC1|nr:hypothetical protein FOC1_g10010388 [Fusarium oxysporum f. sp. cubense race 1]
MEELATKKANILMKHYAMPKNLLRGACDHTCVDDLEPNSATVQVINDGFQHYSADIELEMIGSPEELPGSGNACSYFFFTNGDILWDCFRFLAFQMAIANSEVSDRMFSSMDESVPLRTILIDRDTIELGLSFSVIPDSLSQFLPIPITETESRYQALGVARPYDRGVLVEKTINKPYSDLDSRDLFTNLEESVATLYGQLMVVGKHGRPNMLQETAREFLTSGRTYFEFLIYKTMSYIRLRLSPLGRNGFLASCPWDTDTLTVSIIYFLGNGETVKFIASRTKHDPIATCGNTTMLSGILERGK